MYIQLHLLFLLYNLLLLYYTGQRFPVLLNNPSRLSQKILIGLALFISATISLLELPLLTYYIVSAGATVDKSSQLDVVSAVLTEATYVNIYIAVAEFCVQILKYFRNLRKSLPIIFLLTCTGIPLILIVMKSVSAYYPDGSTTLVHPFVTYYVVWVVALIGVLFEDRKLNKAVTL